MGFTIPEIKTPVPTNVGNEIQSCVGMLNVISWGVSLLKKTLKKTQIKVSNPAFAFWFHKKLFFFF